MNLATSTAEILVIVEAFPEGQERSGARLGTGIEEDRNFRVQNATKGVEKPAVRVDLLAVRCLEAEDELHWWQILRAIVGGTDKLLAWCDGKLTGVLENVSDCVFAINVLLDDTILVDTNGSEKVQRVLVGLLNTIENDADDNFLPCWTTLVPEGGLLEVDNVADVLHNTVECSSHQNLVLVVVRNGDEELGMSVIHPRSQVVSVLEGEVIWITSGSCVTHLHELLVAAFNVTVSRLDGILDGARHGVINAQNGTLNKLDLPCIEALEPTSLACGSLRELSLHPLVLRIVDCRRRALTVAVASILAEAVEATAIAGSLRRCLSSSRSI